MPSFVQRGASGVAGRKRTCLLIVSLWAAALAGCTAAVSPTRLAGDVDVFAAGVLQATAAYREQRDFYVAYRNDQEWDALRQAVRDRGTNVPPMLVIGSDFGAACQNSVTDWSGSADRPVPVEVTDGSEPQPVLAGISDGEYKTGYKRILENCPLGLMTAGQVSHLKLDRRTLSPLHDRLADGLEGYIKGLSVLVSNADRKEFDQAAAAASQQFREFFASTQDIARKLSDSDAEPLQIDRELGIIGDALAKAIAASLEAKRRQEIARIVAASQNVVDRAAEKLAAISRHYHISTAERFADDYRLAVSDANTAMDENSADFEEKIALVGKAEQAFRDFVGLDPAASFSAMTRAHRALAGKVRDPAIDLGDLAGDIQDFYQTSLATLESLRSIRRKISAQPKEGERS